MTPFQLYQYYLSNYQAPQSSGGGIMEVAPVSPITGFETQADGIATLAPSTTPGVPGKSISDISITDIGKAIGFAMNPALGIANMAVQNMTGKSIAQQVAEAVQSMTGGGYGGINSGYGVDSVAGMASGPTHGVDAVNEGSVGADASAGGAAGAAAASAAGSNDGPGGGTFAKGGIVSLYG